MVLKLFIFIALMAPLSGWGFSADLVQKYQNQAREKKLWEEPQWLKLGHYRADLFGFKSPLVGNFFLSKSATNPEAELLATLQAFFQDESSAKASQCRYLARKTWLKKELGISESDLIPCIDKDLWKQQLGASEIYMVFASSDLTSAGSSFGHTFLRAHNPKNTKNLELLDYGINYAAVTETQTGALYALKGLFGFYPGAYSMLPYYQKIKEYTNLEGRNLWEYRLDFNSQEVAFLIDHLLELDGSFAPYYFTNDNCSQQILELLEVVKPQVKLTAPIRDLVIPLDTVKSLKEKGLLKGETLRLSMQAEWRARYTQLNSQQKNILKVMSEKTKPEEFDSLNPKGKAEVLEATLSYLAIKEYRGEGDFKDKKYQLSVERARLGSLTEPVVIPKPESPLLSPDSQRFYLGVGKYDQADFYQVKYRRAFHDLLSNDSALSPFTHLEIFSFDFRYFAKIEAVNLHRFVFLKTLSTAPITSLDKPISWKLDIGTEPKLSPYLSFGAGYSFDFPLLNLTRLSLLGVTETYQLAETAQPHLGAEVLLMSKALLARGFVSVKGLQNTSSGRRFLDASLGVSTEVKKLEFRFEARSRDETPEVLISVAF